MADARHNRLTLNIRTLEHGTHTLGLRASATVADLKAHIAAVTAVPSFQQRILHRGRELRDDNATLTSLSVSNGAVLHMATQPAPQPGVGSGPTQTGSQQQPTGNIPPQQMGPTPPFFSLPNMPPGMPPHVRAIFGALPGVVNQVMMTPGGQAPQPIHPHGMGIGIPTSEGPSMSMLGPFAVDVSNGQPSPDQMQQIHQALSQAMGSMMGTGPFPIPFPPGPPGAVPIQLGHHPGGDGNFDNNGYTTQGPIPGGPPALDERGTYTERSVLEGLDLMLLRLENGNMLEDPGLRLVVSRASSIREPGVADAWAQATQTFLRSCRVILHAASLNRETLAVINRVFGAAGIPRLTLGIRSFPIASDLDASDIDGEEDRPAPHGTSQQPQRHVRLNNCLNDQRTSETLGAEQRRPQLEDNDEGVLNWEDYTTEGDVEESEWETDTGGPGGLDSDDDTIPSLCSESAMSEPENNGHDGATATQETGWFSTVSDADLLLIAGVTVGELVLRFMTVIGQASSPMGVNALIVRVAERLRSMSSLETATARRDLIRQIKLVSGHLLRLAASGAELARVLEYLRSGLEDENMHFLQLNPGFVSFGSQDNQVMPNLGLVRIGNAVYAGASVGPIPTAVHAVNVHVVHQPGGPQPPTPQQTQQSSQQQQTATTGQPVAQQQSGSEERPSPNAFASVPADSNNPVVRILRSLPPDVQAGVGAMLSEMGINSTEEADRLMNQAGGAMNALNRLMVTSLDLSSIAQDVTAAVQSIVDDTVRDVHAGGDVGRRASANVGTRVAEQVQAVLRRHLGRLAESQDVQGFSEELQQMFGIDIPAALRSLASVETPAPDSGGVEPQEAPTAAGNNTPSADASPSPLLPSEGRESNAPPSTSEGRNPEASAGATAATTACTRTDRPPAGLGLGGRGLNPRPRARRTSGISDGAERAETGVATSQPKTTSETPLCGTRAPRSVEISTAPPPTRSTLGGGGGLASIMQSMMQNPAVMDMATSPAMQQAAEQLLGSVGRGGGGLNIGSLMSAAAPALGQLMGMPSGGGRQGLTQGNTPPEPPLDLDIALAAELTAEDAARWKAVLEADEVAQAESESQKERGLSDAYIAALPPRAAGGLLSSILGGEEDE